MGTHDSAQHFRGVVLKFGTGRRRQAECHAGVYLWRVGLADWIRVLQMFSSRLQAFDPLVSLSYKLDKSDDSNCSGLNATAQMRFTLNFQDDMTHYAEIVTIAMIRDAIFQSGLKKLRVSGFKFVVPIVEITLGLRTKKSFFFDNKISESIAYELDTLLMKLSSTLSMLQTTAFDYNFQAAPNKWTISGSRFLNQLSEWDLDDAIQELKLHVTADWAPRTHS